MFGAQGRRQMRAGGGGRGREMAGRLNLDKKKKEKETFLDLIKWPSKNGLLLLSLLSAGLLVFKPAETS